VARPQTAEAAAATPALVERELPNKRALRSPAVERELAVAGAADDAAAAGLLQ